MSEKVLKTAKLILGVLIIFLLLCQLFTFEKFPEILSGAGINSSMSLVVMMVLVITELVSLPFLIGIQISLLVVLISRAAGFISLGLMTMTSAMTVMDGSPAVMFGATLKNVNSLVGVMVLIIMWALLMIANIPTKKTAK